MHTPKRPVRTSSHLFLALAIAVGGLTPIGAFANVKEPSTGESFTDQKGDQALLGVGVRKKWGFKVYAIGLYADKDRARSIRHNDYRGVVAGQFKKTIEIRMQRAVSASKIRDAFEDALEESCGGLPEYQKFLGYFQGELNKGTVILLRTNGSTLEVSIDGVARPALNNARLTGALLNVWLGPKPIDDDLKESLVARLGSL